MNNLKVFFSFLFLIKSKSFKVLHQHQHTQNYHQLFMKKQKFTNSNLYVPKTDSQHKYVEYLNDDFNKIVISTGPAGTGKTLFACQKAIVQMKNLNLNKIIITRPIVTVEEEIGFLPGNLIKKMDPWTKPIFDIFLEYYSKSELDLMLNNGKIEICPLAFMRGRTFKHSFIIADEMQNSSPNQMKMLTTRLGTDTRLVITGDLHQSDILKENGLNDLMLKLNYNPKFTEMIKVVNFKSDEVERSEIVKKIIEIYDFKQPTYVKNVTTYQQSFYSKQSKYNLNNDAALIPKDFFTQQNI
jgi:phosphate starvation-inducible PhoH-like protein